MDSSDKKTATCLFYPERCDKNTLKQSTVDPDYYILGQRGQFYFELLLFRAEDVRTHDIEYDSYHVFQGENAVLRLIELRKEVTKDGYKRLKLYVTTLQKLTYLNGLIRCYSDLFGDLEISVHIVYQYKIEDALYDSRTAVFKDAADRAVSELIQMLNDLYHTIAVREGLTYDDITLQIDYALTPIRLSTFKITLDKNDIFLSSLCKRIMEEVVEPTIQLEYVPSVFGRKEFDTPMNKAERKYYIARKLQDHIAQQEKLKLEEDKRTSKEGNGVSGNPSLTMKLNVMGKPANIPMKIVNYEKADRYQLRNLLKRLCFPRSNERDAVHDMNVILHCIKWLSELEETDSRAAHVRNILQSFLTRKIEGNLTAELISEKKTAADPKDFKFNVDAKNTYNSLFSKGVYDSFIFTDRVTGDSISHEYIHDKILVPVADQYNRITTPELVTLCKKVAHMLNVEAREEKSDGLVSPFVGELLVEGDYLAANKQHINFVTPAPWSPYNLCSRVSKEFDPLIKTMKTVGLQIGGQEFMDLFEPVVYGGSLIAKMQNTCANDIDVGWVLKECGPWTSDLPDDRSVLATMEKYEKTVLPNICSVLTVMGTIPSTYNLTMVQIDDNDEHSMGNEDDNGNDTRPLLSKMKVLYNGITLDINSYFLKGWSKKTKVGIPCWIYYGPNGFDMNMYTKWCWTRKMMVLNKDIYDDQQALCAFSEKRLNSYANRKGLNIVVASEMLMNEYGSDMLIIGAHDITDRGTRSRELERLKASVVLQIENVKKTKSQNAVLLN